MGLNCRKSAGLPSQSPLLVESHGTHLIPPALNCVAQEMLPARELTMERLSPQGFKGGGGHLCRYHLCGTYPNAGITEKKQIFINRIVCTNSLGA